MHYQDLSKEKTGLLFHKFVDGRLDFLPFKYLLIWLRQTKSESKLSICLESRRIIRF